MGWMLFHTPADEEIPRFTKDISDDPVYQFFQTYFLVIQVVFGFLLYLMGGWHFCGLGYFLSGGGDVPLHLVCE